MSVAELIAKTPCEGMLPLEIDGLVLQEVDPEIMTSIMPFKGRQSHVADVLTATHGLDYPAPNGTSTANGQQLIWFGRDQLLLVGPKPAPELAEHAALCDQSDGWAVVTLKGSRAEDVLARLVPVDLRLPAFAVGQTARTLLQHMTVSITRLDERTFRIMAFRSMAGSLVHDLRSAMEGVAARG